MKENKENRKAEPQIVHCGFAFLFLAVNFSEFTGRKSCCLFKHGNEMTGIGKSCTNGNFLYLQAVVCQQQFLSFINAAGCQIFIGRAVQKAAKQTGEILWCDIYLLT